MKFLDSDGNYPSGKNVEDLLDFVMEAMLKEKGEGKLGDNDDDVVYDQPAVASLTQGVQAKATTQEKQKLSSKWTNKVIPITGWVAIALFVTGGLAHAALKDKLPLLGKGDYSPSKRKEHSRSTARKQQKEARVSKLAKDEDSIQQVRLAAQTKLFAMVATLMEQRGRVSASMAAINIKRDELRAAQSNLSFLRGTIELLPSSSNTSRDVTKEINRYQAKYLKCEILESELRDLMKLHRKRTMGEMSGGSGDGEASSSKNKKQTVPSVVDVAASDDASCYTSGSKYASSSLYSYTTPEAKQGGESSSTFSGVPITNQEEDEEDASDDKDN